MSGGIPLGIHLHFIDDYWDEAFFKICLDIWISSFAYFSIGLSKLLQGLVVFNKSTPDTTFVNDVLQIFFY